MPTASRLEPDVYSCFTTQAYSEAPRSPFREAMTGCASPVIHGDPCETRTQHYQLERLASSPIRRRGRMATPTGLEPAIS